MILLINACGLPVAFVLSIPYTIGYTSKSFNPEVILFLLQISISVPDSATQKLPGVVILVHIILRISPLIPSAELLG